ncbi:hypothetical protein [Sandaracinus amylolyticus]|uniref:Uncharacterized protein n=1 Tax=Sandaracinus amylolyticus TaxID=927083 RepID=A0A0F6YH35_9BACT|nr:hypothetical protein [Sandaracinus amylolyticus]AKF05407.1 hypothetical protein DB32_002556 [Sandaracinus amylolyticus]
MSANDGDDRRKRLTTVFGWIAGGALGLLLNYVGFLVVGEGYPTVPTTFVAFLLGAFGGMALADKLGVRGFRPLGIAAGVLLALFLALVVAVLMSPAPEAPL